MLAMLDTLAYPILSFNDWPPCTGLFYDWGLLEKSQNESWMLSPPEQTSTLGVV